MTDSLPLRAPSTPPETGASTKSAPAVRSSSAACIAVAEDTVEWSITTLPGAAFAATARQTSSTSASALTQSTITLQPCAIVCAVAALENLRIIEDEKLVDKVARETGPYLKAAFARLADHPLVGHAESIGMAAGLNLVRRKGATVHDCEPFARDLAVGMVCRQHMFDNGVIMRAVGDRMIVAPPLVMTCAQIDEMVARIRDCLDLTLADVAGRGWMGT